MIIPFKEGVMHLASSTTDESYLIGSKCQACGAVAFPKRVVCHKCLENVMEELALSRRGKLASFTVALAAPEGFKPPIVQGYIDLPEGIRLFSLITGCKASPHSMELGQDMELVFEELRTDEAGNKIIAYGFTPLIKGMEK